MPETVIDEYSLEITDRAVDTTIHDSFVGVSRHAKCRSVGTASMGQDGAEVAG